MRSANFFPTAVLTLLIAGSGLPLQAIGAATGSTKFIPTFLFYYGGGPTLTAAHAPALAKFDLLDFDRFRYNQIAGNTWSAIKSINPNVQIYLYELGSENGNFHDYTPVDSINDIARYGVPGQPDASRGHSMGTLNINHPELFLTDSSGNRLYNTAYSFPNNGRLPGEFVYLMDFGAAAYQSYWVEAVKADIVNRPWVADGVFADNCTTLHHPEFGTYASAAHPLGGAIPTAYPDNTLWSPAMTSFAAAITAGIHANTPNPQKLWCTGAIPGFRRARGGRPLDWGRNPPDGHGKAPSP